MKSEKGWKVMTWLWMVHIECKKKSWVKICLKKWNPFVIDEFSSETLILRRRLSSLYTKCIQFFPNHLNFLAHATWLKLWYHASFQPFQRSFAVLFNFRVILSQNKSWNAWKIANEVRKGLKSDEVTLNGEYWMQKKVLS